MGKKSKSKKGRPLGGLADALVKAGVVDESAASKAQREQRRENKGVGKQEAARREAERQAAHAAKLKAEADAARARASQQRDAAELESVRRLLRAHLESAHGNRRWFFVTRDGHVPFVEVADAVDKLLYHGRAGIVESMGVVQARHIVVSDPQTLAALKAFDPEMVRLWNDGGPG